MTDRAERRPRRIAYIHDANVFGGMEVLQQNMLRYLDRERYEPYVLVPGYDDELRSSPREFLDQLRRMDVPILKPPHPGDRPLSGALRDVWNIAGLLRRERISVAHIQTRHPGAARKATVAVRLAGVPGLVRTEHLPPSHHLGRNTRLLLPLFDRLTDYILTDSDSNREEQIGLLARPPHKVLRSYCGIDALQLNPDHDVARAKVAIGLDPGLPVVGAIARLHVQKGVAYLVAAAAQVIRDYGPTQFLIVGDGPLRGELEAQAAALGLGRCLRFVGFQADYVPFMQAMDVGVMPSLWEGFSISMQEYMALAKPLVVTDHRSFLEALGHEQQALVAPTRDADALAASIMRLLREPELARRLGRAALQRVRSSFSIQRHMCELMDIYDSLCAGPRASAIAG